MSGGTEKLAIDLEAADILVDTYRSTSRALDEVRRKLAPPWSSAQAHMGPGYGSVPDVLRGLIERTEAGARDLEWRLNYIRARYPDRGGHRLQVLELPRRLPALQRIATTELVSRLRTGNDLQAIRETLEELLARSAGHTGVAIDVIRRLTAADVDRLLTHPDLIAGVEDLVTPLGLLVAYAHSAQPLDAAHLFQGDEPIDVLRMVMLLRSGGYPAALVAEVLDRVAALMSDPTFAWRYATIPTVLAESDSAARAWLFRFENPVVSVLGSVTDPAVAFELAQMSGMVELLLDVPTELANGQSAAESLSEANRVVGNLLALADQHLAALFDRATSGDPKAIAGFTKALAESYDMLLALRDTAPDATINGDPVRDAAARLTSWHFTEMAGGGWPLGESSGAFARWMAVSDDAMAALIVGASGFLASVVPTLVARFEANPVAGELSAAIPLDQLKTVLAFLTFAVSESPAGPKKVSEWRALIDLVWSAAMTIAPGVLIPGTTMNLQLLRLMFRRFANSSFAFIADAGGVVSPIDVDSIADVLAELFFTIDGFGGSNDIEDVRPLQIALFAQLLGYHPGAVDNVAGLREFVIDGNLIPPPISDPGYGDFLEGFAEATTSDSDLARHYLRLWDLITEWATKGVQEVEVHTS